jgi:hypothetical protein
MIEKPESLENQSLNGIDTVAGALLSACPGKSLMIEQLARTRQQCALAVTVSKALFCLH